MSAALSPAVVFRRRSGWEAADMGILLWRANLLPLLLFIGVPGGVLFILNVVLIHLDFEYAAHVAALIVWWFKPLLDRFCLQVVSIRFFEPSSSFRRLFRGLGKTVRTGLLGDLFWRRFSPFRSARMPLLVLERLKGKTYRHRAQLLTRNGLGFGLALTLICAGMNAALQLGEMSFMQGIIGQVKGRNDSILEFINEENMLVSSLFWITLILMESLYVCMGFGLYINARVETEGWDIELLFKKCVSKVKWPGIIPVLTLLFLFAAGTGTAWTQENPRESGPPQAAEHSAAASGKEPEPFRPELLRPTPVSETAKKALEQVLESPDFGTAKPSWRIQFKQSDSPARNSFSFPGLQEISGLVLRFVMGAALIALICFGALYAYRRRSRLFPGPEGKGSMPPEPAPDEPRRLLEQAEELHRAGRIREAWALCFRAFIAAFTRYWFLSFPAEATEYETLAVVRKAGSAGNTEGAESAGNAGSTGFAVFVRRWIVFAYGGREPAAGSFEEAVSSCRRLLDNPGGRS